MPRSLITIVNGLARAFKTKPVMLTGANRMLWSLLQSSFTGRKDQQVLGTFQQTPNATTAARLVSLINAKTSGDRHFFIAIHKITGDLSQPVAAKKSPESATKKTARHPIKKAVRRAKKKAAAKKPVGKKYAVGPVKRTIDKKTISETWATGLPGNARHIIAGPPRSGADGAKHFIGRRPSTVKKKNVAKAQGRNIWEAFEDNDDDYTVRPVRKGRPSSAKPTSTQTNSEKRITCYTKAEMDKHILLNQSTLLSVTISLEKLTATKGMAMALSKTSIQPGLPLVVSVRSILNIQPTGKTEKKINAPVAGSPVNADFTVKGTQEGKCTVAIDIRQGQVPLCTLKLNCICVSIKKTVESKVSVANAVQPAAPYPVKINSLEIRQNQMGENSLYEYRLELIQPVAIRKKYSSPVLGTEHSAFISNLYAEIDQLWGTAGGDVKQFHEGLRDYGARLFNKLFPANLQEILYQHAGSIHSIQLVCDQTLVPWELVLIKKPGDRNPWQKKDKFLGEFGLIRWLEEWVPPDNLFIRKGRARYVIPDYQTDAFKLPGGPQEKAYLERKFEAVAVKPDPNKVNALLKQKGSFDLLHFCCHGQADLANISNSKLMLEEKAYRGALSPTFLTQASVETCGSLRKGNHQPIIVINSCKAGQLGKDMIGYTGFACAFLNAEAGVFVGSLWEVEDAPAVTFVKALYDGLLGGKHLFEATIYAREEARKNNDATWISYVVYGHPFARLSYTGE